MSTMNQDYSIASNMKKYRKLNKLTQEQLAEKLGLDTQYYAQCERGERNFSLDRLCKATTIFQIGIEDIIEVPISTSQSDITATKQLIIDELESLSHNQLIGIINFIKEITPLIK